MEDNFGRYYSNSPKKYQHFIIQVLKDFNIAPQLLEASQLICGIYAQELCHKVLVFERHIFLPQSCLYEFWFALFFCSSFFSSTIFFFLEKVMLLQWIWLIHTLARVTEIYTIINIVKLKSILFVIVMIIIRIMIVITMIMIRNVIMIIMIMIVIMIILFT